MSRGREIRLNAEYGKDSWGFIAKDRTEGISRCKFTNTRLQGKGVAGLGIKLEVHLGI